MNILHYAMLSKSDLPCNANTPRPAPSVGEGSLSLPMTFTHEFSRRSKEPCLESFIKAQYLLPCRLAHHPSKHKDRQGKRSYGVCICIHLTQIATFLNKVYVVAEICIKCD